MKTLRKCSAAMRSIIGEKWISVGPSPTFFFLTFPKYFWIGLSASYISNSLTRRQLDLSWTVPVANLQKSSILIASNTCFWNKQKITSEQICSKALILGCFGFEWIWNLNLNVFEQTKVVFFQNSLTLCFRTNLCCSKALNYKLGQTIQCYENRQFL